MTNIWSIVIPTFAVLLGVIFNRQETNAMRAEIGQLRTELKSDINSLRGEMIQLRDSIHRDMIGLHERVAAVEARQGK